MNLYPPLAIRRKKERNARQIWRIYIFSWNIFPLFFFLFFLFFTLSIRILKNTSNSLTHARFFKYFFRRKTFRFRHFLGSWIFLLRARGRRRRRRRTQSCAWQARQETKNAEFVVRPSDKFDKKVASREGKEREKIYIKFWNGNGISSPPREREAKKNKPFLSFDKLRTLGVSFLKPRRRYRTLNNYAIKSMHTAFYFKYSLAWLLLCGEPRLHYSNCSGRRFCKLFLAT